MFDLSTVFQPKMLVSAITGAVATGAAFRRDLAILIGGKSLISQIKEEEARLKEVDKSLQEFTGNVEDSAAARQAFENDRRVTLERLQRLTTEFARRREDPNYDLSFVQRLFLGFHPESRQAQIIQWAARIFMILGLVSAAVWVRVANQDLGYGEYVADALLLTCYGALAFRAWGLAERRWGHGYNPEPGLFGSLFVLRKPTSTRMLAAQIGLSVCIFWVVESLEDFAVDVANRTLSPAEQLVKFVTPLVAAILCRLWAAAELKRGGKPTSLERGLSSLLRLGWKSFTVIMCIVLFAGATVIVDFEPGFLDERFHKIAFVLQAVISCVALSQWLSLVSQFESFQAGPAPSKANSTAA